MGGTTHISDFDTEVGASENQTSGSGDFIMGQTIQNNAYRIVESVNFPRLLNPFLDYIVYDPGKHQNKLFSEHVFEQIIL
jgi:hypothetical protein